MKISHSQHTALYYAKLLESICSIKTPPMGHISDVISRKKLRNKENPEGRTVDLKTHLETVTAQDWTVYQKVMGHQMILQMTHDTVVHLRGREETVLEF